MLCETIGHFFVVEFQGSVRLLNSPLSVMLFIRCCI